MDYELHFVFELAHEETVNVIHAIGLKDLDSFIKLYQDLENRQSAELKMTIGFNSNGGDIFKFENHEATLRHLLDVITKIIAGKITINVFIRSASAGNFIATLLLDFVEKLKVHEKVVVDEVKYDVLTMWHEYRSGSIVTSSFVNALDELNEVSFAKFEKIFLKMEKDEKIKVEKDGSITGKTYLFKTI